MKKLKKKVKMLYINTDDQQQSQHQSQHIKSILDSVKLGCTSLEYQNKEKILQQLDNTENNHV